MLNNNIQLINKNKIIFSNVQTPCFRIFTYWFTHDEPYNATGHRTHNIYSLSILYQENLDTRKGIWMCILGWHGQGIDENKSIMLSENGLRLFIITKKRYILFVRFELEFKWFKQLNYRAIYLVRFNTRCKDLPVWWKPLIKILKKKILNQSIKFNYIYLRILW